MEDLFSLRQRGRWPRTSAGRDPPIKLLREILVPPQDPEAGAEWRAPLDGAELVYFEPGRVRVGCSENDRRCRQNEVFFRWVEAPGFWMEKYEVDQRPLSISASRREVVHPPKDGHRFVGGHALEPVVGLSWRQARDFALGRPKTPVRGDLGAQRPDAGRRWRFPWGNAGGSELANVWDEKLSSPGRGPVAVGSVPPNRARPLRSHRQRLGVVLRPLPTRPETASGDGSPLRTRHGQGGSWRFVEAEHRPRPDFNPRWYDESVYGR